MGSMGGEFSRWLEGRLTEILGFQSSEIVEWVLQKWKLFFCPSKDIFLLITIPISYIVGLDNDSDRHGYLVEMLDPQNCPEHQTFLDQFQVST